ncbi:hypothetical protein GCM10023187_18420 [Nibrella viscosa]|uniref:Two-component system, chemotaxis family, CheB/CheR fusion protein n=1 Tax=Nibrella viscosa TaxID=1084524 RepID=A0ABP8KAA3_9BACT
MSSTEQPADGQPTAKSVPVVAIGASAGGFEAFSELLRSLPPDTGLAYVYIQHLDPTYDSRLATLLGKETRMPVAEAQHLMRVEPNHVYVIPPNTNMEIVDSVLTLQPRQLHPTIHMPIDEFFVSLSERQKAGAIGVLLSGMNADGILGLRAIKAVGGLTFVQDETAKYRFMPQAAIVEGVADLVLSPAEIARELGQLSSKMDLFQLMTEAEEADIPVTQEEELKSIIQLLRKVTGADFSQYKMTTVRRRIIRRMLLFKFESLSEYAQHLRQQPEEAELLYGDLLINVTSFFRDPETMDYVQKIVLPQILKTKKEGDPIRIWVPACSTGQEAYSLAMMFLELFGDKAITVPIQIFATDISESAIIKARQGAYTRSEVMEVSPRRLQRFFTKVDDQYRINKAVRDLCVFAPHNLFKDPPFSRLDLVSCRNLLIYLDNSLQKRAISAFHYALNSNGFLLLGKSESVSSATQLFSQLEKPYKVFSRRSDATSHASFDMSPRLREAYADNDGRVQAVRPRKTPAVAPQAVDLEQMVDNLLLRQYIPPSVLVNQDMDILQFRGSTGLYLAHTAGKATLNLLKMVRPELVFDLRSTILKARKAGQPVRKTGLKFEVKGKPYHVAIEAVPIRTDTEDQLYLIIFEEDFPVIAPESRSLSARNQRIKELEEQLASLREDMRSVIEEHEVSNEELQSANEEIISSNEELQSMNEELETSKEEEEIESTNEELMTINQELQLRNDQLSEAYQFSEAIFTTIREATLILDKDLRVLNANKAFHEKFRTEESEIEGRLIYEIGNRRWDIPQLRQLLANILSQAADYQQYEVTHTFPAIGEKVLMFSASRVSRQTRQDAILLAIEDLTDHRRAQQLLEEREIWFHTIADNAPFPTWVSGPDGRYTFVNQAWLTFTGSTLADEISYGWARNIHPDDRESYLTSYHSSLRDRKPFSAEYRLKRHDDTYHWMLENAKPMFFPDGTFNGYIGTCADVHLQKELNTELDRRVQQRTQELDEANQSLEHTNLDLTRTANSLQAVLDSSPAAIAYLKALYNEQHDITDFQLAFCNEKFAQVNQKPMEDILGGKLSEEYPALYTSDTFEQFRHVTRTGVPLYLEFPYQNQDKASWLAVTIIRHDEGIILTGLDVTALKEYQHQLEDRNQALQRSNQTLEQYAYAAAHDLQEPLRKIQTLADLLQTQLSADLADPDAKLIGRIHTAANRMQALIKDLLTYSRLSAEKPEQKKINLNSLLAEVTDDFFTLIEERRVTLHREDLPEIRGSASQWRLVFRHLLDNALKFYRSGVAPEVTIRSRTAPGWAFETVAGLHPDTAYAEIMVQDNGLGFDPQYTDRIFDPFKRLHPAGQYPGTGIGLALCKRIIENHDGAITAVSRPGEGTTFLIYVPVKAARKNA